RAAIDSDATTLRQAVSSPYPLFSHTYTTGSSQIEAMFKDSWKVPSFEAPSPKKHSVTLSSPCIFDPRPAPVATGSPEPTIDVSPSEPIEKSDRCIEPPLPWFTPSTRPNSSAIKPLIL